MKKISSLMLYSFGIIFQNNFSMIKQTKNLLGKFLNISLLFPKEKLVKKVYLEKNRYGKDSIKYKLILPYQKVLFDGIIEDITFANNNDPVFEKLKNFFQYKSNFYKDLSKENYDNVNFLNIKNNEFKKSIISNLEYLKNEIISDAEETENFQKIIKEIAINNNIFNYDLSKFTDNFNYSNFEQNKEKIFLELSYKMLKYEVNNSNRDDLREYFKNMYDPNNISFLDIIAFKKANIIDKNYEYIENN